MLHLHPLSGATRVHFIVGDPIAQVKSPAGVSQLLIERGLNAYVMPAHVAPVDLADWVRGVSLARNVDSIIVTVPHKFACFGLCATATPQANFLGAVNVMRRNPNGSWHGDMCDGTAYVAGLRAQECDPDGRRAFVVGAGGAGSAIAHALVLAGVANLAIHDADPARRDALIARLSSLARAQVVPFNGNLQDFEIAINATPCGMLPGDALPFDPVHLARDCLVGCVITAPAVPPLIEAARRRGCPTMTGTEMFAQVRSRLVDFLLGA